MQVEKALWLGLMGDLPPEWTEYMLCLMYKCLPSQLDEESWDRVQEHLIFHNARAKHSKRLNR